MYLWLTVSNVFIDSGEKQNTEMSVCVCVYLSCIFVQLFVGCQLCSFASSSGVTKTDCSGANSQTDWIMTEMKHLEMKVAS